MMTAKITEADAMIIEADAMILEADEIQVVPRANRASKSKKKNSQKKEVKPKF